MSREVTDAEYKQWYERQVLEQGTAKLTIPEYKELYAALASVPERLRARLLAATRKPEHELPHTLDEVDLAREDIVLAVTVPLSDRIEPLPPFVDADGFKIDLRTPSYLTPEKAAMVAQANEARLDLAMRGAPSAAVTPALVHGWRTARTFFALIEGTARMLDFVAVTRQLAIPIRGPSRQLHPTAIEFAYKVAATDPTLCIAWADTERARAMASRETYGSMAPTIEIDARGDELAELPTSDLERMLLSSAADALNREGKTAREVKARWRARLEKLHATRAA